MKEGISKSTIQRLPVYLTYLKSLPQKEDIYISATAIAAALHLGEVQVRKDLAAISDSGKPKLGYRVYDLRNELESVLGYRNRHEAILVGTGKLGRALLDYNGFGDYGLNIVAGFDVDATTEEKTENGKMIFHLARMQEICKRMKIQIGIITVPAQAAQTVCDEMLKCNIQAILNFAPVHLEVPSGILVRNENIAASLAALSNEWRMQQEKKTTEIRITKGDL